MHSFPRALPATVNFHGQPLTVITGPYGEHLVAMRPICESIGLDWKSQLSRIRRDDVLSTCVVITTIQMPGDDQRREVACLPLEYLNGWLFGIDSSRCGEEIRPALRQYKRECFQALAAYWMHGEAINPRGATIGQIGARCLSALIASKVQHLPRHVRRRAMMRLWAHVHAAYGVPRGADILAEQFDSARNLVAACSVQEGEWIPRADTGAVVALDRFDAHYLAVIFEAVGAALRLDERTSLAWALFDSKYGATLNRYVSLRLH